MSDQTETDLTETREYKLGFAAQKRGEPRDVCPFHSGFGTVTAFSVKRHRWMVGHLDAEFERWKLNDVDIADSELSAAAP